jgi:hypothetical protein
MVRIECEAKNRHFCNQSPGRAASVRAQDSLCRAARAAVDSEANFLHRQSTNQLFDVRHADAGDHVVADAGRESPVAS